MSKLLTLSKNEIEERTVYYIEILGDRGDRRAIAARALLVSLRSVDAWCAPSDPRVIPADKLMQLVIESHFRELYVANHQCIIDIYDDCEELIGGTNREQDAAFLADVHCGRIAMRPRGNGWSTPEITMSEEQILRSRLRRVIASGKVEKSRFAEHWAAMSTYSSTCNLKSVAANTVGCLIGQVSKFWKVMSVARKRSTQHEEGNSAHIYAVRHCHPGIGTRASGGSTEGGTKDNVCTDTRTVPGDGSR